MTGSCLPAVGRRALGAGVFGAGAVWGLSACTGSNDPGGPAAPRDPDADLAGDVVGALEDLLALHAAVVARHPRLAARVRAVTAAHEDHRAAVIEAATVGDGLSLPSTPGPTGDAESPELAVSARARPALAAVASAEAAAAEQLSQYAFRARSGPFARLIAGMAASSHQHALALGAPAADHRDGTGTP